MVNLSFCDMLEPSTASRGHAREPNTLRLGDLDGLVCGLERSQTVHGAKVKVAIVEPLPWKHDGTLGALHGCVFYS